MPHAKKPRYKKPKLLYDGMLLEVLKAGHSSLGSYIVQLERRRSLKPFHVSVYFKDSKTLLRTDEYYNEDVATAEFNLFTGLINGVDIING